MTNFEHEAWRYDLQCLRDANRELAALRERVKHREQGYRELLSAVSNTAHHIVPARLPESIRGELEATANRHRRWLESGQPPASTAEPDPTPLRTCLELLAQLGVEAQYLNRAGDVEALRAMAGRLTRGREGL